MSPDHYCALGSFRACHCHDMLGVLPSASQEEVKTRYRQLALTLHPDMVPGCSDEEAAERAARFGQLTEAYRKSLRLARRNATVMSNAGGLAKHSQAPQNPRQFWTRPAPRRSQPSGQSKAEADDVRTPGTVSWANSFAKAKGLSVPARWQGQPWKW
eukprot:CAMPEP_0179048972 /NCGR_PEP_ID=MMETSP0796-20121207/19977_1 /TAXON_ID=73915 /ORGANISM="Pyrodinium bahamense, Strain pbaha01" /LENGTH=156 /DNA_ID=CAMNT_0020745443 /DNA_START=126 /DNA_END=593 /DNA_ORIENTATION=-